MLDRLAGPGGVGGASSFRFCLLYCSFVLRVFRLSVCLCFLFVVWCFLVWMTSDLVRLGGGARRRRAWRRRVAICFVGVGGVFVLYVSSCAGVGSSRDGLTFCWYLFAFVSACGRAPWCCVVA